MSQGLSIGMSQPLTPIVVEDELPNASPELPRKLVRSGKEPVYGSRRARAIAEAAVQELLDEDPREVHGEPDLGLYFDEFGTDVHRRIALCRAYASYLAAQVGIQRRRTRVIKKIRYGNGHDSEEME